MGKSQIYFTFDVNGGSGAGLLEILTSSGEKINITGFIKGTTTEPSRPELGNEVRCAVIDANSDQAIKLIQSLVGELKGN